MSEGGGSGSTPPANQLKELLERQVELLDVEPQFFSGDQLCSKSAQNIKTFVGGRFRVEITVQLFSLQHRDKRTEPESASRWSANAQVDAAESADQG